MIPMSLSDAARATKAGLSGSGHSSDVMVRRVVTDSREVRPGDLFVAVRGTRLDGHAFVSQAVEAGAGACLCDRRWLNARSAADTENARAVSGRALPPLLIVPNTIEALGRLAAHYRCHVMSPGTVVVAITGTNGKTTTKAMLEQVLSREWTGRAAPRSFNNALGVPLTLLSADAADRYLIVEIGSNAPGEVDALARIVRPHVGVITSVGEAHLEGLVDLAGVIHEKCALLDHVRGDGLCVVNGDEPRLLRRMQDRPGPRVVTIGTTANVSLGVSVLECGIDRTTIELDGGIRATVPMPGRHHATNAAAVFAVARWFGMEPRQILEGLATFAAMEGRTRAVAIGDDVDLIDDAYNSNPASMAAVVQTLAGIGRRRRVLVMGDMLELGEASAVHHARIVEAAVQAGIEVLLVVGPRMVEAAAQREFASCDTRFVACEDAADAAAKLADVVQVGDVVWVKGSRGMGLERVVEAMRARRGSTATMA